MCEGYLKADPAAWKKDLEDYRALLAENEASIELTDAEAWAMDERIGFAEAKLLAQPAPNAEAVVEKLTIIFDDELWSEIDNGEGKRTVIGDIFRLAALCAEAD